jgi:hypothetical protein
MITVINKHHTFYVGRGSPLGNRFVIGVDGTRDEVIEKYRVELLEKIQQKDKVICEELNKIYTAAKHYPVYLQCFCKGFHENCHADIVKDIIDKKLNEKK